MSYTPITEYMNPLGFTSPDKEKASYRIWTNQANTRQIRVHRSPGSTWLDFYERPDPATPWRKLAADPSPATQRAFHQQLAALGWMPSALPEASADASTGANTR